MMSEPTANDNDSRSVRLKKIRFRAWHRGTREMDMLLGRFVESRLDTLNEKDLETFEVILQIPDQDLYKMLVDHAPPPEAVRGPLMDDLIELSQHFPQP